MTPKTYTDDMNPYKQWHMRRVFRVGWEAAEEGVEPEQAQKLIENSHPKLNQITTGGWWRGFRTQRGER
jgi:hypothetical protein